jgi:hypothetical protein
MEGASGRESKIIFLRFVALELLPQQNQHKESLNTEAVYLHLTDYTVKYPAKNLTSPLA